MLVNYLSKICYAYLDPGSGSYIFQLLIASIVGLGFVIKVYWKRLVGFFKGLFSRNTEVVEVEDEDA